MESVVEYLCFLSTLMLYEDFSSADEQYDAQLRRYLVEQEKQRRLAEGVDVSVPAIQEWALKNVYGGMQTGFVQQGV